MRWVTIGAIVFAVALVARMFGERSAVPQPFDDAYHWKRIAWSVQHFPRFLEFDPDRGERGAFCPWPPLYDLSCAAIAQGVGAETVVRWLPPIFFSIVAAVVSVVVGRAFSPAGGLTTGIALALSPYLISVSRPGAIDHHFVEPAFALAILLFTKRDRGWWLGLTIAAALLVQPALIIAAGIAFLVVEKRDGAIAFSIAAIVIAFYRMTRPEAYPDSAWFLGWPHVGVLVGAAVACALTNPKSKIQNPKWFAIAAGAATALAFRGTLDALLGAVRFVGRDPWLDTIVEFQPMFRDPARWGTDAANITGAAFLAFLLFRGHRKISLFAIVYLVLALTSRRFLVPAIPLLMVAGGVAVAAAKRQGDRWIAIALTLLPPLVYDVATIRQPEPSYESFFRLAADVRSLPPGRVLAPWSYGHAIDVIGRHAVVIDNFGPAPSEITFINASLALLMTDPVRLRQYCAARDIRYLALPDPRSQIPATAASIDVKMTRPQRTVWWRLKSGVRIEGFDRVTGDVFKVQ